MARCGVFEVFGQNRNRHFAPVQYLLRALHLYLGEHLSERIAFDSKTTLERSRAQSEGVCHTIDRAVTIAEILVQDVRDDIGVALRRSVAICTLDILTGKKMRGQPVRMRSRQVGRGNFDFQTPVTEPDRAVEGGLEPRRRPSLAKIKPDG